MRVPTQSLSSANLSSQSPFLSPPYLIIIIIYNAAKDQNPYKKQIKYKNYIKEEGPSHIRRTPSLLIFVTFWSAATTPLMLGTGVEELQSRKK